MVVKDVVVVVAAAAAATTIAAVAGITVFVSEAKSFCFANVCWLITFFDMYCVTVFFFLPAATATGVAAQSSGDV